MKPTSSSILVIGLGNILLSDEGVGVHVVGALTERYVFSPDVDIVDGGTIGLDLLPFFEGRDKVLIVDAVDFGQEPGFTGSVEKDKIPSVLNAKLSVHHINLSDVLYAAKLMEIDPAEICLIGVQPESLDVGLEMTSAISGKMEVLIDMAVRKLHDWGIAASLTGAGRPVLRAWSGRSI